MQSFVTDSCEEEKRTHLCPGHVDRLGGLSLFTSVTPLLLGNTANATNLDESSDSV